MIRDTLEFRMPTGEAQKKLLDLQFNQRFIHDGHVMTCLAGIMANLVRKGVPDDEAVERALAMTDKVMQGMLDRGWAVMAPTLDERLDDRRVGFRGAAE
jgi:CRISPR/Cas system-associated protein endoribonuclease Cas2